LFFFHFLPFLRRNVDSFGGKILLVTKDKMERPPTEATAAQKRKERPVEEEDAKLGDGAQESSCTTTGKRARRGTRTDEEEGSGDPRGAMARGWGLLESLDPDTSLCVLSFLPAEDLVRQRAVSRRWGDLASADCLWKPRFLRLYGPPFLNGIIIVCQVLNVCFSSFY
jgi:hypothetical protein